MSRPKSVSKSRSPQTAKRGSRPSMSNITQDNIGGWHGYRLSVGDITVGLVPDVGGRIMSYRFKGEEMLYVHLPEAGKIHDISLEPTAAFKDSFGFHIIGGDKAWVAPECSWVSRMPPVDLDLGRYSFEIKEGECIMTSPVCRETGLRIVRFVSLKDDGALHIREEFHNMTSQPLRKGIWTVVQIPKPFDVYVPASQGEMRSYHLDDPSLLYDLQALVPVGEWQRVAVHSPVCFKFGGVIRSGCMLVLKEIKGHAMGLMWDFPISDKPEDYAHASAVEVFNSSLFPYGEVEMHAPLRGIPSLGCVSFKRTVRAVAMPLKGETDMDKFLMPIVDILGK